MDSHHKMFLPTEYATAYELIEYVSDPEKFSYEYLAVFQLTDKNQIIDKELMKQAIRFLIIRHPNMLAYYERNKDGKIERKYAKFDGKIFVEFDSIKSNWNSDEMRNYIKSKRSNIVFTTIPNQRYYFIKTTDDYIMMTYSHHSFKDVYIESLLAEELFNIYHILLKDKNANYIIATKDLDKIPSYEEVLNYYYKEN